MKSMNELFEHSLKDVYNAEKQITKALPKLAKAAKHPRLKEMFTQHLEQTKEQVRRLEEVSKMMGIKPTGMECKGMRGLIEEGSEAVEEFGGNEVGDAGLIVAAQKVEHYEIGTYGTMITWAEQMGKQDVADILKQTLNEEEQTDKMLSELAESEVNRMAIQMEAPTGNGKSTAKKTASPRGKASVR